MLIIWIYKEYSKLIQSLIILNIFTRWISYEFLGYEEKWTIIENLVTYEEKQVYN